ncbi:MAG: zinc ribbon domain-containing protein [Lactobacillus mulieris]|uniref:zinc ribbon domain-containing protein n=1 Tax=Lactobacillus mulieris TaxID=2508708 RepID=UPI001F2C8FD2|nr:zinc ribbon domain-containing protein [Lactobacillus mulieris]MCF1783879.1 zinc ribbon domain-containing protein [Lactobacillus mulieris]MCT7674464.1 zinc ribbon domain-containing protein [Lactobacillus mulieris]MCT7772589.1 zinc ribbon domain-containing protein [Lactobacillus mulieris]MCW8104647.1 zinc ribbon domain-containing protein [Lactobacillus mulieris]
MKECPNCHAMVESGDKFCTSCGFKFTAQETVQPVQQQPQSVQPVQQVQVQQTTQQTNESLKKLKNTSKSYWNWLLASIKTPSADLEAGKWYGIITIIWEVMLPGIVSYFTLNSALKTAILSKAGSFANNAAFSSIVDAMLSRVSNFIGMIILSIVIIGIGNKIVEILISYYTNDFVFKEKYTKKVSFFEYSNRIMSKNGINAIISVILTIVCLFTINSFKSGMMSAMSSSNMGDIFSSFNSSSTNASDSSSIISVIFNSIVSMGIFVLPMTIADYATFTSCISELMINKAETKNNRTLGIWLFIVGLLVVNLILLAFVWRPLFDSFVTPAFNVIKSFGSKF